MRDGGGNVNAVVTNWTNNNTVLRAAGSQNLPVNVLDRIGIHSARFIANAEGIAQEVAESDRKIDIAGNTVVVLQR